MTSRHRVCPRVEALESLSPMSGLAVPAPHVAPAVTAHVAPAVTAASTPTSTVLSFGAAFGVTSGTIAYDVGGAVYASLAAAGYFQGIGPVQVYGYYVSPVSSGLQPTSVNGNFLVQAPGGLLDLAVINGAYAVVFGTGTFAGATGAGVLSVSFSPPPAAPVNIFSQFTTYATLTSFVFFSFRSPAVSSTSPS